jgi:hypothetical protein
MGSNSFYSKAHWEIKLQQWLSSGKSAKAWCQENQVVYTTFLGWRNRLKYLSSQKATSSPELHSLSPSFSNTHFVELKNQSKIYPGISLECEGVKIHLSAEFDGASLRKCLDILRGAPC